MGWFNHQLYIYVIYMIIWDINLDILRASSQPKPTNSRSPGLRISRHRSCDGSEPLRWTAERWGMPSKCNWRISSGCWVEVVNMFFQEAGEMMVSKLSWVITVSWLIFVYYFSTRVDEKDEGFVDFVSRLPWLPWKWMVLLWISLVTKEKNYSHSSWMMFFAFNDYASAKRFWWSNGDWCILTGGVIVSPSQKHLKSVYRFE